MLARRIGRQICDENHCARNVWYHHCFVCLQILFTYLGELGELKPDYNAWQAFYLCVMGCPSLSI